MNKPAFLQFGEQQSGYHVPVLNERELRAGAGILFVFAIIAAANVWTTGNLSMMRLLIVAFSIEFILRTLVNPTFAPSLVLGRFMTRKQTPEYVGAPQKRFAWALGLAMAIFMLFSVVIFGYMGPINMIICLICLTLLFFETSFGICVGCKLYNLIPGKTAQACPGGACSIQKPTPQTVPIISWIILLLFVALLYFLNPLVQQGPTVKPVDDNCEPPAWVHEIGHEQIWKEHHNCL